MYLPQFHEIPENNEWWGQGFTEWTNVRKALPLYKGHLQPRVPFGENYYNLSDHTVMLKQMDMARRYGVDGFVFIIIGFMGKSCWRSLWNAYCMKKSSFYLIAFAGQMNRGQELGMEKAKKRRLSCLRNMEGKRIGKEHFEYLNMFFRQEEYIKVSGKPVIVLYKPGEITNLKEMLTYWEMLAKEEGYPIVYFKYAPASRNTGGFP